MTDIRVSVYHGRRPTRFTTESLAFQGRDEELLDEWPVREGRPDGHIGAEASRPWTVMLLGWGFHRKIRRVLPSRKTGKPLGGGLAHS